MIKPTRNVYTIKTTPYNDNEKLENLLNEMSKDGWDLYSMQEIENDDDVFYNCIFIKEVEVEDEDFFDNLIDFKPRIERIISPELDPYELCLELLKKIKDKRQKISQVKSLIDNTSEDSRSILNDEISRHISELEELKKRLSEVINPDIMEKKLGESKLTLSISEELADILDSNSDDNLLSRIVLLRQNLTESLGYILPKIKIEIDETLDESEFAIKVRGINAINAYAYYSKSMFLEQELNLEELPEGSIKSNDIISGLENIWIDNEIAKDYWVKGLSTTEYISAIIEYVVIKYIDDIFDYSDVNRYIEVVGNQNLYLVDNIIPDYLSVGELKYILASLIKEKVSIKDIVYIFEKINDFADEEDKESLLERLRVSLARQISSSLCTGEDNTVYAFELSPESIKHFDFAALDNDEVVKVDRNKIDNIVKKLQEKIAQVKEPVLLVPMEDRHIIYLILSQLIPNIRVIAREELTLEYPLKIIDRI